MPRSISFVFFSLSLEYSCNSYTHIYWKSLNVPWWSHKSWISNQAGVLHRFCPFRCSVNVFDIGEPPSSSSAQAVGLHSYTPEPVLKFSLSCQLSDDLQGSCSWLAAHWLAFQQAHRQHTEESRTPSQAALPRQHDVEAGLPGFKAARPCQPETAIL